MGVFPNPFDWRTLLPLAGFPLFLFITGPWLRFSILEPTTQHRHLQDTPLVAATNIALTVVMSEADLNLISVVHN